MRINAMAVEEVVGEKRRKACDGEIIRLPTSTSIQIAAKEDTRSSGNVSVSCCCSNESTEEIQLTDFEESVKSRTPPHKLDTRSRKPRSEINSGSGLKAKTSTVFNRCRKVPAEKLPPATELEEFFASAEKELHKRFKEKYNYDIVNDAPLEGRFQWVPLKP